MDPLIQKGLTLAGLDALDSSDCLVWAFGENFEKQIICDLRGTWNSRHGQLFQVRAADPLEDVFYSIGKIYRKLFVED